MSSIATTPPAVTPRTFGDRVGGRWALSVRGFLITFVLVVLGYARDFLQISPRDAMLVVSGLIVGFALNALFSFVLHRTRWTHRCERPIPIAEFVAWMIFTGVVFAAIFAVLRTRFDVVVLVGTSEGFVVYPALSLWIGSSVVVYLDVFDQARRLRGQVIDEHANSLRIRSNASETVALMRRRIDEMLTPQIDRLRIATTSQGSTVSEEIRRVVDGPVRTTSRELWRTADEREMRIGLVEVITFLVRNFRFRPWPIVGLAVVLSLLRRVEEVGWIANAAAAIATVVIVAECHVANRAMERWPRGKTFVVSVTFVVFVTQAILTERLLERWGLEPSGLSVGVVALFTSILMISTSSLGAYRDLDDRRARQLATAIRADRLDAMAEARAVSDEARQLAALLHGRVQSRLLGCAMAIEFAGDDPTALQQALDRTKSVLAEEWDAARETGSSLGEVLTPWKGLAEISVVGEIDELAGDPACVQVVEELVANAVRHGGAHRVEVIVERDGPDCMITVADDGQALGEGRPGLGTSFLERVGVVDRRPSASGWVVSVRVSTNA
jgi:signal transduction histidine kinase